MSMHVPDHMVDVRYSSRIATLFSFILSNSLTLSDLTLLKSIPDKYGIAMFYRTLWEDYRFAKPFSY